MEFDHFTLLLLATNPEYEDGAEPAVWDGHLAHLASLHESGELVAAGPVQDDHLRGICILTVDEERAREIADADPAVRAGIFTAQLIPWRVPKGVLVHVESGRLPRSTAEASS